MADISKIKLPNGSEYNLKDSLGRKEAYLEWGGKNFSASYGPIDAAMIGSLGANRLELVKPDGLVFEFSRDGGSTWTDYGLTDFQKMNIFSTIGGAAYIGKYESSDLGNVTTDWMLRATLISPASGVYTVLNKFAIYLSTNGSSGGTVTIDACRKSDENTFLTFADKVPIGGWSGWNIINCPVGITTYGNSTSQYSKIRFTFSIDALSTNPSYSSALAVLNILGFGGAGWATPNNLAKNGHLYTYNAYLAATFPNAVTATQFNGPLNGNASTATSATIATRATMSNSLAGLDARSTNQLPSWYITNYPFRMVKEFKTISVIGVDSILDTGTYCELITDVYYTDASGGLPIQLAISSNGKRAIRFATNQSTWGAWENLSKLTGTSPITVSSSNVIAINDGTTAQKGAVKLNTATNSTSTTEAATPSAVKIAKDRADEAYSKAATVESGLNGNLIYDQTFTISNGVATFTPHVYLKGEEVTSTFAASCFVWKYRLIDGSEVTLATKSDRGCDVTITSMGYGGHVIGAFTPQA